MKVSIITAVFNRHSTLEHSISSVQSQTYPNIEHIFVDGLSNDGSVDLIRRLMRHHDKLISEKDSGIYDALNKGILMSTGDIIGVMHSDDYFSDTNVVKNVVNEFLAKNIDAVYGDLDYVSKTNSDKILRHWKSGEFSYGKLKFGWMPPHPTLFLRKEVFHLYGLYNQDLRISADYDAILRYFKLGNIRAKYIPRVLVKMRIGGESNKSFRKVLLKTREDFHAIKSNKIGGIMTLICKNIRKLSQFF